MKKKLLHLTVRQWKSLEEESKTLGISSSELIRRILDSYIDDKEEK